MTRVSVCGLVFLLFAASPPCSGTSEQNKELVREMVDVINQRDFGALDQVVAPNVRRHSAATPGVKVSNRDEFVAFLRNDLSAVPDAVQEIRTIVAEGDLVALRAIYRGTQTGPMGPFPPSGKKLELPFLAFLRIEEGLIAEMWVEWDNLGALAQLGYWPPETQAETSGPDAAGQSAQDEANKALARRWFEEVINERRLDTIADIYREDYVYHGQEGLELRGHDAVREFAAALLAASADGHAVVKRQVVEGEQVVTQFISRGTHTGTFRGIEPTGKPWTTEGIVISRIENGKIAEEWEIIHTSGLEQ